MKLTEKRLSGKELYHGKIIRVQLDEVELENGAKAMREVVRHPGGVCAAILTEKDELLFVRQFRYPYAQVVLECPAGKLEPGEDPDEAIKREQKEETGTTSSRYIKLGEIYPTPGYCDEILHLYACRVESYGDLNPDEDEFLEVERIPLQKAVEIQPGDTPEVLQRRVMEQAEWILLPQAVELVSSQICKESCR